MPTVRFEVWWSDTAREIIVAEADTQVSDVIETVRHRVGAPLPLTDALGHLIEYALYAEDTGRRAALLRRLRLRRGNIQPDAQLYLADRKQPWWEPRRKRSVSRSCRLQLAPGCVVEVSPAGLTIGRYYLTSKLPLRVRIQEELRGDRSPLTRVTRERHCSFFRGDEGWMVQAHKPSYIGGTALLRETPTPVTDATTITLGQNGWTIVVHLDERTE
jgi:hypothetical protein